MWLRCQVLGEVPCKYKGETKKLTEQKDHNPVLVFFIFYLTFSFESNVTVTAVTRKGFCGAVGALLQHTGILKVK